MTRDSGWMRGPVRRAAATLVRACAVAGVACSAIAAERIAPIPDGIGRPTDMMGSVVALSGDTAIVGAPQTNIIPNLPSGVVDIYRLRNGVWQSEAQLWPPPPLTNQYFGIAVAVQGDVAVVADQQSVYTYERDGETWQLVDQFGAFVSATQIGLSGDTLAWGGAVYVRSGSGWELQATLMPDGFDTFRAMAIDGDLLVAAADGFSIGPPPQSAYFFSRSGTTWTREARVQFLLGYQPTSVSISGHTALVGVVDDGVSGAHAHVYDRNDAGQWADSGTLDTGGSLQYGAPVSIDGDRALVGSPNDYTGYAFLRTNGVWSSGRHFSDPAAHCFAGVAVEGATGLVGCPYSYAPSVGYGIVDFFAIDANPPQVVAQFGHGNAHANESFGTAVAAIDDTMVVTSATGVHFYDRTSSGWTETATFPPTPTHSAGRTMSFDGTTVAIAYPAEFFPGGTSDIAVYTRSGGIWTLTAVIPLPLEDNVYFGEALVVQGDILVISEGSYDPVMSTCRVFQRSGSTWQALPDLNPAEGMPGDRFCSSLAMSGSTLLVGAPGTQIGVAYGAGAVYAFDRRGTSWTQRTRFVAPVPSAASHFGSSLAMTGSLAVVGSNDDSGSRGEANVYHRAGTDWVWQATLQPPGPGTAAGDYGYDVAISGAGDRIVVTAPLEHPGDPHGAAYLFAFDGTQWSYASTLHAAPPYSPPPPGDGFGFSAAFAGSDPVIGAPTDGVGGAVYVGETPEAIFANGFDPSP